MSVRLRVRYPRPEDFLADHESQMTRGGLLVRGEPPPGIALYQPVELELAGDFAPLATPQVIQGQVVQVIAGVGVAVAFDPAPLAALAEAAAGAGTRTPPARSEQAAKIQQALHGSKDDRARILRDTNRMLHPYVLKNPALGIDEVLAMAKMSTMAPETLAAIAERREWASRPEIAIALVRNPKTPTPLAVRLLEFVALVDLRQLAKDTHTRAAVQQAARRKVLG